MPTPHFYLKKPEASGECLIYFQVKYFRRRFVWSFNQKILPQYWDAEKERIVEYAETTDSGLVRINDLLNKIVNGFNKIYLENMAHKIPNESHLKTAMNTLINKGYSKNAQRELRLALKRRNNLEPSYVYQQCRKDGIPAEMIKSHPDLLLIKKKQIITKRLIKTLEYDHKNK